MKATNQNQNAMRAYAQRHDTGYDARAREIRAENARRAAAALAKPAVHGPDRDWLDIATRSVPAYEVLA